MILLSFGCPDVREAVKSQLAHNLVLAFSLDSHLCIIVAFNHGDSDIENDVSEEHRGDNKADPE